MSHDEQVLQDAASLLNGDAPDFSGNDDCAPDPDEPTGFDENYDQAPDEAPEVSDMQKFSFGFTETPEAVKQNKKLKQAVETIFEYQRNIERAEKIQQAMHEQAEADHSQAVADEDNFRKIITALEQFTADKLPGIIKKNVEGAADSRLDRSVDDFKRQLDNVVSGLSNELFQTAREVRTSYWQQVLKQILFAVITSAVITPLSILIFKSFWK